MKKLKINDIAETTGLLAETVTTALAIESIAKTPKNINVILTLYFTIS